MSTIYVSRLGSKARCSALIRHGRIDVIDIHLRHHSANITRPRDLKRQRSIRIACNEPCELTRSAAYLYRRRTVERSRSQITTRFISTTRFITRYFTFTVLVVNLEIIIYTTCHNRYVCHFLRKGTQIQHHTGTGNHISALCQRTRLNSCREIGIDTSLRSKLRFLNVNYILTERRFHFILIGISAVSGSIRQISNTAPVRCKRHHSNEQCKEQSQCLFHKRIKF